jgi:hypothetical protein
MRRQLEWQMLARSEKRQLESSTVW